MSQLRRPGLAGDRGMRHGPPASPPQRGHRPGSLLGLRMGLRHRAHGAAQVRRRGPAPLLRKRFALQPPVLMRISYEWLGDYVDTNGLSPHDAAEFLTMSGTKIESVQVLDLSAIIVGRVLEQKDHPSSNKPLWIHQVDVGGGKGIQIIAGAPNAVAGTLVPVALPGTRVPSGTLVRDAKIAGEAGQGMLCSADELLLGEEREPKIMLLDRGEPGESLAKYIPPDAILEAEITPNRPDCLGHIGVARELAAASGRDFKADFMPPYIEGVQPPAAELIDIAIEVPDLCSRFVAVPITGVKVAPSPDSVQRR